MDVLDPTSGAYALAKACLLDAVDRLRGLNPECVSATTAAAQREDARQWFLSDEDETRPYSFAWTAHSLGLSASALRRKLREEGTL